MSTTPSIISWRLRAERRRRSAGRARRVMAKAAAYGVLAFATGLYIVAIVAFGGER